MREYEYMGSEYGEGGLSEHACMENFGCYQHSAEVPDQ